jgi:hypothetical protein
LGPGHDGTIELILSPRLFKPGWNDQNIQHQLGNKIIKSGIYRWPACSKLTKKTMGQAGEFDYKIKLKDPYPNPHRMLEKTLDFYKLNNSNDYLF